MADVSGTIGNEYVELNNAATEATLKLLLAATMSANKQNIDQVKAMATKAGLDPASVAAANVGLKGLGTGASSGAAVLGKIGAAGVGVVDGFLKFGSSLTPLIGKLVEGSAGLSDMMSPLAKLPGVLGLFGAALTKAAEYQEANLRVYQQITQVGANFGGSLTDLRQAALNSYMSLTEFGTFVKSNGEALARMGGSVDGGTRAFVRLSKDLISSDIGTNLMALGYSTEQINSTMATYIASTGGRTRQEMQNTQALATATSAYMTELDALTQFTGTSKDKLAEEAKKAAQNEAFQRKLSTMDEAERAKTKAAYDKAAASGIAGATDLVMSAALGLPPVTKAAQTLSGVAPGVAAGFTTMTKTAMDQNRTMKDVNAEYGRTLLAGKAASQQFGQTGDAIATMGGEYSQVMNGLIGSENKLRAQGIDDEEEFSKRQEEIRTNMETQGKSQAADMAKANKAISEIGQVINNMLAPAITFLTKIAAGLTEKIAAGVKSFDELGGGMKLAVGALAGFVALLTASTAAKKAQDIAQIAKDKLQTPGSSPTNPMYVVVVGGSAGGATPGTPDTGGGKKGGKFGRLGGVGLGLAGSIAGDLAADALGRDTTAGKGADMLGMAASGAGMGAMLGPWGALAGGLIGGGYGAYKNFFDGPKMANGGVVTKPTVGMVGENEPEIVSPLRHIESLRTELETLNKQSAEMLRFMRDTAENTRRNTDATVALGGDLFKF
jgi:hypothetical protein